MPTHDWTRVHPDIFHDFQTSWIAENRSALNQGMLPSNYYALVEQHGTRSIADVLTLQGCSSKAACALAEPPPKTRRQQTVEPLGLARRRSLAIRHVSGHRLVALLEILSPANKDRRETVDDFVRKAVATLDSGVHLLLVDLFPPGLHDPCGIHSIIRQRLDNSEEDYDLPADEPFTFASYAVGTAVKIFLEHAAVGASIPEPALFLSADRHVKVPLQATYDAAYRGMPAFWRDVLEGREPQA